jgi:exodeoxyribonuclease VII small subunit
MRYFDQLFKSLVPASRVEGAGSRARAKKLRPLAMATNPDSNPQTFEAALAELETIVATMEDGRMPLADALAAYKRGAELLQYCQAALKDAQQQVQVLERGVLKAFAPEGEPGSSPDGTGAARDAS